MVVSVDYHFVCDENGVDKTITNNACQSLAKLV